MDLATLLNEPSTFEYGGKTYQLRAPTLDECAEYQRQLEQEARASAARATELPDEDRRQLLVAVQREIVAGVYAWGGEVCALSLRQPDGVARMMSIVMRDQEVSFRLARKIVETRLTEIAELIAAARESEDPDVKRHFGQLLTKMGLPGNYFASSSPESATRPSEAPPTSPPSAG